MEEDRRRGNDFLAWTVVGITLGVMFLLAAAIFGGRP